jgi:hypothetical protein
MVITDHAKQQLRIRFGIKENVEEEIAFRTQHSKLLSPLQVNRCGTRFQIGCTYLRNREMILVFNKDKLINVFFYYNPFRMIKREAQNLIQRSLQSGGSVVGNEVQSMVGNKS